jgi:hypothetical protein
MYGNHAILLKFGPILAIENLKKAQVVLALLVF